MTERLALTGAGLGTGLGHDPLRILHALRAGISRLVLQRHQDRTGKWLVGGRVMSFTSGIGRHRLAELAAGTLAQAAASSGLPRGKRVLLVTAAPEPQRPGYTFPWEGFPLAEWAAERTGWRIAAHQRATAGAASALSGLAAALEPMRRGEVDACVVLAADNLFQLRTLRWFEDHWRLRTSYETSGFYPGEGTACLVVETERALRNRRGSALAFVTGLGLARDPAPRLGDAPTQGLGLTEAVRQALQGARRQAAEIGRVWSDLNGESERAREWTYAEIRNAFTDRTQLTHPADAHGDLGCAVDTSLLVLAATSLGARWDEGPVMVCASSDGILRGAAVLEPAEPAPHPMVSKGAPRASAVVLPPPAPPPPPEHWLATDDPPRSYHDHELAQELLGSCAATCYRRQAVLADPAVPWTRLGEIDAHLLAHLDAILAHGPTALSAAAHALSADEGGLRMVAALVLASLEDQAAHDRLAAALAEAPEQLLDDLIQGLRLSAGAIPTATLMTWTRAAAPALRAAAIEALADRAEPQRPDLQAALQSGAACERRAALRALQQAPQPPLLPRIELLFDDPAVRGAALLAAVLAGSEAALALARRLVRDGDAEAVADAAPVLGLRGRHEDVGLLLPRAADGLPAAVLAVGSLGFAEGLAALRPLLERDDEDLTAAVARAFAVALGLPPEPALTEPEGRDALDRALAALRPAAGRVRMRRGAPFADHSPLLELERPDATADERWRAHRELVLATGKALPFRPDWYLDRQQTALARWRGLIRRA